MKYKYLLFDNDGTLMDFKKAEEFAFEKTYKSCGCEEFTPYSNNVLKLYSDINDSWWKKLERKECTKPQLMVGRFADFLKAMNITGIKAEALSEAYPKHLSKGGFLFEGAKELVEKLSKHYDIYIITNGIGFVQESRIKECDYYPYIKGVFISELLNAVKPDKEYFDKVLSIINAKESECLIIGDSLTADIKGGNLANIDTLWFNPEKAINNKGVTPTYEAAVYNDILALLL